MRNPLPIFLMSSLLATGAALAQTSDFAGSIADQLNFTPGSQFTATLDQTRNLWRIQPANGQDVVIDAGACTTGAMASPGVWLLVVDADGRAELLAPSVTHLPAGSPDRIALRACDKAHGQELAVPQTVLDLLTANTGAIYVAN